MTCHICTSISASTNEECLAQMQRAAPHSDLFEIRLDGISKPDVSALIDSAPKPVICTNRPVREMGKFKGEESERIALLEEAEACGAEYIDIELDAAAKFKHAGKAKLIVSYHNFEETPSDLQSIYSACFHAGADIAKLAVFAHSITDNVTMFRLLAEAEKPTIGLCMGEHGQISRILAPKFGSYLTFASVGAGKESAPGQIEATTLINLYRFRSLTPQTPVYGVVGNPVGHSMSPSIHNAAFTNCGIDAVYVPLLVNDVAEFLEAFRELGFNGFSVTIPHKEASIFCLDEIEPLSEKIGAINTIHNRNGKLAGSNTDLDAAISAIEEVLVEAGSNDDAPIQGKRALIIGAGGAGRAIAYGLQDRGADVTVANRTLERATRLAEDIGCKGVSLRSILKDGFEADVLVNASSVGMHPNVDDTPIPAEFLKPEMLVFDAVYNPIETRLLREAREAGCPIVTGFEMFVRQAVGQFELWTGVDAPTELMAEVVRTRLEAAH
ncbi:MAG: shikimate dehydrogenase [Planctomycetota bacterium]|nr:shikimate dehydrogenase [Planctomycetota bacterium]